MLRRLKDGKPERWGHDVPPHREDWQVNREGTTVYGDSDFLRAAGRVPGFTAKHVGYGDFDVVTPKGDIAFSVSGRVFPGQVGRSHIVSGPDAAMALLFRELHVEARLAEDAARAAAGEAATPAQPAIEESPAPRAPARPVRRRPRRRHARRRRTRQRLRPVPPLQPPLRSRESQGGPGGDG